MHKKYLKGIRRPAANLQVCRKATTNDAIFVSGVAAEIYPQLKCLAYYCSLIVTEDGNIVKENVQPFSLVNTVSWEFRIKMANVS